MSRALIAFLAFLAAVLFLALSVFDVVLGDVPEIAVGLLCIAIGLALNAWPGERKP